MYGLWVGLVGGSSSDFDNIGMARFTSAYEVALDVKGLRPEKTANYNDSLDFRDKMENVIGRNADKLREARESIENGNNS